MARARGSASVGLVGGKGFSCHLRLGGRGGGSGAGESREKRTCDTWSGSGGVRLAPGGDGNFLRRGGEALTPPLPGRCGRQRQPGARCGGAAFPERREPWTPRGAPPGPARELKITAWGLGLASTYGAQYGSRGPPGACLWNSEPRLALCLAGARGGRRR